jgi:hypothetical protein
MRLRKRRQSAKATVVWSSCATTLGGRGESGGGRKSRSQPGVRPDCTPDRGDRRCIGPRAGKDDRKKLTPGCLAAERVRALAPEMMDFIPLPCGIFSSHRKPIGRPLSRTCHTLYDKFRSEARVVQPRRKIQTSGLPGNRGPGVRRTAEIDWRGAAAVQLDTGLHVA